MGKGFTFFIGLGLGIAAGGFGAYKLLKDKFSQQAEERIGQCQTAFLEELARRREAEKEKEANKAKAEEAIKTYSPEPEKAAEMIKKGIDKPNRKEPYEIPEEEFEDPSNPYKSVGITYFPGDAVFLDENNHVMIKTAVEEAIGIGALAILDEQDDHVVFRNEEHKCDYDVIVSSIRYSEWQKRHRTSEK